MRRWGLVCPGDLYLYSRMPLYWSSAHENDPMKWNWTPPKVLDCVQFPKTVAQLARHHVLIGRRVPYSSDFIRNNDAQEER